MAHSNKTKIGNNTEAYKAFHNDIENLLGYKLCTPRNFRSAAGMITHITGKYLSESTLKRFWGYLKNYEGSPSLYTLNTLAEFLGYADYTTYTELNNADKTNAQQDNTLYCIKRDLIKLQTRIAAIEQHLHLNNDDSH